MLLVFFPHFVFSLSIAEDNHTDAPSRIQERTMFLEKAVQCFRLRIRWVQWRQQNPIVQPRAGGHEHRLKILLS